MITLRQAEAICEKDAISFEEVEMLQGLQLHIVAFEGENNKRTKKLYRTIDKKVQDFFGL